MDAILLQISLALFGAYVQQDDILMSNFTPCEILAFAARIRTSLSELGIQ